MDWAILIFEILLTVAVFLIGLFVKNYLPSYMDEKGKNLATKEDIEEITRKTEEVQQEFREGFELFSNDVKFKYDFFYKQYSELYCKLYAIIIQSEYVRHHILLFTRLVPFNTNFIKNWNLCLFVRELCYSVPWFMKRLKTYIVQHLEMRPKK